MLFRKRDDLIKKFYIFIFLILALSLTSCKSDYTQTVENISDNHETEERIPMKWYVNYSWMNQKWGDDPVSKKISEITNIDIEYVAPNINENDTLMTMIASGTLPDILTIWHGDPFIKEIINKDMVYPLNELADKYYKDFYSVAVEERLNWYKTNENIYGYPNASYVKDMYNKPEAIFSNQSFLVRKDIYEAIGSPNMSTPEGFLNALKDAKNMFPIVDNKPLIPLGMYEFTPIGNDSLQNYLQNFLAIPYEKDGKLIDRELDENYIQWLKTLRKANEMGLMSNDVFVDTRTQVEEKVSQKQYFALFYQWSDIQLQNGEIYSKTPNSVYIAVDGPKNKNSDPHTLDGPSIAGWTVTMISKNAKHPDKAIKLLSYLMSEEGQKYIWAGVEGDAYTTSTESKIIFKQEAIDLYKNNLTLFRKKYGASATHWPMMDNQMAFNKGFLMPEPEFVSDSKKWSRQYAKNFSIYMFSPCEAGTEEAIIEKTISEAYGKTLISLILAKSEQQFDNIWNDYISLKYNAGFNKVMEKRQIQLEQNKLR